MIDIAYLSFYFFEIQCFDLNDRSTIAEPVVITFPKL